MHFTKDMLNQELSNNNSSNSSSSSSRNRSNDKNSNITSIESLAALSRINNMKNDQKINHQSANSMSGGGMNVRSSVTVTRENIENLNSFLATPETEPIIHHHH